MNDLYLNLIALLGQKKILLSIPEIQENYSRSKEIIEWYQFSHKVYIKHSQSQQIYNKYSGLLPKIKKYYYHKIDKKLFTDTLLLLNNYDKMLHQKNEKFISQQLKHTKEFFDDIDGKSLDDQQRVAVLTDEDNNLVVAGAGSGKTLVVAAKVKYLVERLNVEPEQILLLSFTKKAADEMQTRVAERLKINVEASTFHKLGLSIIGLGTGMRPDIYDDDKKAKDFDDFFNDKCSNDKSFAQKLIIFFGMFYSIPIDYNDFEYLGDAYEHINHFDLQTIKSQVEHAAERRKSSKITINGERVKSFEEVLIANYLYLNGIRYTYEKQYPFNTANEKYRQYKPDFYLDDYDIYLEHFGINREDIPCGLPEVEQIKYMSGIDWKRGLHQQYKTKLIETYSYYCSEGIIFEKLDELMKANKVEKKQIDYVKVYQTIFGDNENAHFKELKKLLSTFIDLYKSNGYGIDDFQELRVLAKREPDRFLINRSKLFIDLAEELYKKYEENLQKAGEIDFNDMINKATALIENHTVKLKYKYIIIDEYQDISNSRFRLSKALRDQNAATIMAVGDDWQSIYRFAGSDIGLFTNFQKYLGYTKILKIEQTYRNSQDLIDIASKFILENPKQIPKALISKTRISNPIILHTYLNGVSEACENVLELIAEEFGKETEVLLLGRNNFDLKEIESSSNFSIKLKGKDRQVIWKKQPKLKISFLTVHRSKGLEAEHVILLNSRNSLLGFPNKMADDPVLTYVLTEQDEVAFAEERRLFYVAITRTKNRVHLLVPATAPSTFVKELTYMITDCEDWTNEIIGETQAACPRCITGKLIERQSSKTGAHFLGCSHYPLCDYTCKVEVLRDGFIECPECGGYMLTRKGPYGSFYGCTNFPICEHKQSI